ncbi:DUF998 domain-containing protein [Dermatobacter hominis]|uniref:DUF998 domain-containing protein n=1 Tax=Dermatobacter hominis TaxID=2884263 RepID=UPI001D1266B5|nr:DUF998 domain-containing protein [Dermatobacter hominis]UDY37790.1 DUF998 domain-containing protein [Dermatobacter hominis]
MAVGVAAAVAFPAVVLWDGATRGAGYDPTRHWISLLSLGERALLGRVSLAVAGLGLLGAGVGLVRLARPSTGPVAAQVRTGRYVAVMGIGLLVACAFPIDPAVSYPVGSGRVPLSVVGAIHALAGSAIVLGAIAACWSGIGMVGPTAGRVAARAVWCWVSATAALGAVLGVYRRGNWELARSGLFQRASLFAALACIAVLGVVALRSNAPVRESDRPVWAGPIRRGELQRTSR